MTNVREQFHKTTEQYFQNTNEKSLQSKSSHSVTDVKKFYIKEGPFKNSTEVEHT